MSLRGLLALGLLVVGWGCLGSDAATTAWADEPPKPAAPPADKAADGDAGPTDKAPAAGDKAPAGKVPDPASDPELYELFRVLVDTMHQVEQNYVQDLDRRELIDAAIDGLMSKLDPYSTYVAPDEVDRFRSALDNQFGGIGIQVEMRGGQLTVLSPIVGSPAYRAGVQPGDTIVEIEGQSTKGISLEDAVRQLKGEPGTSVKITVQHPRGGDRETLSLRREIIELETVLGDRRQDDDSWDFMLDDEHKIGYIRITAFGSETADVLDDVLADLKRQGLRGLILDLRFNPGGLLKSAIDVSDLFISEGVIVSTRGRNTPERVVKARKPGTYEGFPMVVLVNHHSASASEVVSACLQDHGRAVVIGERTFGKGSVQNVVELEGGHSALKLTTATYWRPSGRNIHRFEGADEDDEWGVMPNEGYVVELSDEETVALIQYRHQRDLLEVNHYRDTAPKKEPAAGKDRPAETERSAAPRVGGELAADAPPKTKPADAPKQSAPPKPAPAPKQSPANPTKPASGKQPGGKPGAGFVDRQLGKALEYLRAELDDQGDDRKSARKP